jgi:hypothetical protein
MTKFVAGMLMGFFLATALMAGFVQVYMGPYYETVKTSKPYAQALYNVAHTQTYTETQAFVAKVNEAAGAVAALPVIGNAVDTAKISQYAQMALDTLKNAKQSSEVMLQMVNTTLTLIESALPIFILSLVMIGAGYWMYQKDEAKQPAKKGRKK